MTIILLVLWCLEPFLYYGIFLMISLLVEGNGTCDTNLKSNLHEICQVQCKTLTQNDYVAIIMTSLAEIPSIAFAVLLSGVIGRKFLISQQMFLTLLVFLPLFICMGRDLMIIMLTLTRGVTAATHMILYLYTSEAYPTHIRGIALGACSAAAGTGSLFAPFAAQVLLSVSMEATVSVFVAAAGVCCILGFFLPSDDKDKSVQ